MGVRLTLWALVCAGSLMAAEVQNLSEDRLVLIVGQPSGESWRLNEPVCVFRQTQRIACGYVENKNDLAGRIILSSSSAVRVEMGDWVERVPFTSNVFAIHQKTQALFITHESNRLWQAGDTACLARQGSVFACGLIIKANAQQGALKIYESWAAPGQIGDEVRRIGGRVAVLETHKTATVIAQAEATLWKIGQPVAFFRNSNGIATGRIKASRPENAEVELTSFEQVPTEGDIALPIALGVPEPIAASSERETAAAPTTVTIFPDVSHLLPKAAAPPGTLLLSLGLISVGSSVRFLRFEKRLTEWFHLGSTNYLLGGKVSNGEIKGFALSATGTFQPLPEAFAGLNGQIGFGITSLTATGEIAEKKLSPAATIALGWRWTAESGISLALTAGDVISLSPRAGSPLPSAFPFASVEVGFLFE